MKAHIKQMDRAYGVVELDMDDGYHVGTTVTFFVADDGTPVVQIDTPENTETHDLMRVYMNDAIATNWREP